MRTLNCLTVNSYQFKAIVRLAMLVKQLSSLKCAYHNIKDAPIEQEINLTCPENSRILEHSLNSGHPLVENDFKILGCCDNLDIRTLESLYIHKLKPSLNDQHNSTDLFIIHL